VCGAGGSARGSRADSGGPPESSSTTLESDERALGEPPNAAAGPAALPNKMRFHPQRWAKVYDHWLTNIQDWCISRQLWWGHRVPVWRPTKSIYDGWVEWNLPFDINQLTPTTDLQSSPALMLPL